MIITSESITEGHPDKICDAISDAVLDAHLAKDPDSRVAVETVVKNNFVMLFGEVSSKAVVDYKQIARDTLKHIGYSDKKFGMDYKTCDIKVEIEKQSVDIAQGVDASSSQEQGAGDQGIMYGYASDETPQFMPLPILLAHKLTRQLAKVRKEKLIPNIGPDGKSQVSVGYIDGKPNKATVVVIAQQHLDVLSEDDLKEGIKKHVIPVISDWIDKETIFLINATGKFIIGGPQGDSGLTGRKIIVDTYGGVGRHGGGAFSGKDPSKVDRSGAYYLRYIAKNVVAAGLAKKCELQIGYAIGVADPVGFNIDTFGTNKIPEEKIMEAVKEVFDTRPGQIIKELDLKKPIYFATSSYGHFGRDEFSWEKLDKVEELRKFV